MSNAAQFEGTMSGKSHNPTISQSHNPTISQSHNSPISVIDVGNTSTAIGVWKNGKVSKVSHCDGGFADASKILKALPPFPIAYASVVPDEDAKWIALAKELDRPFHQISHRDFASRTALPICLDYPRPETIGADRLADAVGAVARYGAPVLVMDFGTALTAAIVTHDGAWRGGVIAPGFPLMRDYLFERTAKLPRMRLGCGKIPKIGRSTEEAMRFGALVGYRGMVREIVAQLKSNFSEDFRLVATGGFAKWALKDSGLDFTIDPTLTLFGAGLIGCLTFQSSRET